MAFSRRFALSVLIQNLQFLCQRSPRHFHSIEDDLFFSGVDCFLEMMILFILQVHADCHADCRNYRDIDCRNSIDMGLYKATFRKGSWKLHRVGRIHPGHEADFLKAETFGHLLRFSWMELGDVIFLFSLLPKTFLGGCQENIKTESKKFHQSLEHME